MNENYFAVIPMYVMRMKISPNAKLLFGEITSLTKKSGECIATNRHFSEVLGVSERTITNLVSELVENELIKAEIEQNGSGTWRSIYPIFQWGGRKNCVEGVEASFVPKEINTKRINILPSASLQESSEDVTFEEDEDTVRTKKLIRREGVKGKGYDPSLTTELLEWAETRNERRFPAPIKQKTAISAMLSSGYSVQEIQDLWEDLESDEYWGKKGVDFTTVLSQIAKRRVESHRVNIKGIKYA